MTFACFDPSFLPSLGPVSYQSKSEQSAVRPSESAARLGDDVRVDFGMAESGGGEPELAFANGSTKRSHFRSTTHTHTMLYDDLYAGTNSIPPTATTGTKAVHRYDQRSERASDDIKVQASRCSQSIVDKVPVGFHSSPFTPCCKSCLPPPCRSGVSTRTLHSRR